MVAVTVAGVDRTCDTVSGSLRIGIGRKTVREKGQPSYCSFTVRVDDGLPFVSPFDRVQVDSAEGPRFSGTVAEVNLSHDSLGAWQTVNAVGPLASWGRSAFGEPTWPRETIADRVQRIADLIGEPITIQGGDNWEVDRQDVDNKSGADLLSELADAAGAFLFDTPTADGSGMIWFQSLDARRVNVTTETWAMEPAGESWDAYLPADGKWWEDDNAAFLPLDLSGCWVRADPGPAWVANNDIANRLLIEYGATEVVAVFNDAESQALYGIHEAKLETPLDDLADVNELAAMLLARTSEPLLYFPSIEVDVGRLPTSLAAQLLNMVPGNRVTVHDLPQPAPAAAFLGCVEGWEETHYGQGLMHMTLFVSDIRHSMAVPSWDELPPTTWLWDSEPAGETWESELA